MQSRIKSSTAKRRFVDFGKRSELFSVMTLDVELMKNDSMKRLFLKSFSKATI